MYYLYVERGLRRLCVIRQDLHVSFTMCVCVFVFTKFTFTIAGDGKFDEFVYSTLV